MNSSNRNLPQLVPSIEKLFHYLLVHTKTDIKVTVYEDNDPNSPVVFQKVYRSPERITISPTLYTRLDDCHGAGNCCRVPFDLVYTSYDRQRILGYDHEEIKAKYGAVSADRFNTNRANLLSSLVKLSVTIESIEAGKMKANYMVYSNIYVKENTEEFFLSGKKSCPYLFAEGDRYFCGVHPFKPLHCWYPHMTVRSYKPADENDRPPITIGRMQYGRNHNFGCPVIFTETVSDAPAIFAESGPSYFDSQFRADYEKLEWTSNSARSLGLTENQNFAVGMHEEFRKKEAEIRSCIRNKNASQIDLWHRA